MIKCQGNYNMTEQQKTDYLLYLKNLGNKALFHEFIKCHEWIINDGCSDNDWQVGSYKRREKHSWCYDTCWNELKLRLGDWLNG